MSQPQLKRRRLLSNSFVPLLTPNILATSLKPSRISTCTSCHRAIGLKSSPPLVCARFVVVPSAQRVYNSLPSPRRRCSASTCAICVRTCIGVPLPVPSFRGTGARNPSPYRLPSPPPLGNPSTASPTRRRRARDEDIDTISKVKGPEREGTGCGRTICRICCLEILQSETVACLDCFSAHRALQAHGSDAPMLEPITDNVLTVSA
ncbi:hypothetical protein H4582DRAFT_1009896 [Lactarius indigo]|nr:hypothetical protein H4582DRAFT_1009896 [Lactarius indigo]